MPSSRRSLGLLWSLLVLFALGLLAYTALRIHARRAAPARIRVADPAALTPSSPAVDRLRSATKGANVVIVVLDAARADHFRCYGYPRDTTPNCDRLATEGFLFENHFVQCPETKPSTASLFTGQYPDTHLAYDERKFIQPPFTLAQGFHSAGYHTVLFSQNGFASPMWALGEDFDEAYYEPQLRAAGGEAPFFWRPEALLEQVSLWLGKGPRTPFLAYVHFMPPHDPYIAPLDIFSYYMGKKPPNAWRAPYPFEEVERDLRATEQPWSDELYLNRYDANLRYADMAVAQLEQMLRDAGLLDNTILIVTADHGEAFGEHGHRGHTISVFDESIHVPLVMKLPDAKIAAGRIHGLTQTIDLLPTLCDLFEVPYPRHGVQGRSLLPLMAGKTDEVNDYVFSRSLGHPPSYAVRNHDYLLLLYQGGKLRSLYDLRKDPRQLKNVIAEQPRVAARMEDAFRSFAERQAAPPLDFLDPNAKPAQLPKADRVQLDEETRRTMRALGYVK